jgi:acetate---CoA ligase (ADP-forming)
LSNKLESYIRPNSVAVIGASTRKASIGNTTIKNFKDLNFKGKVYGINPRYDEIEGFKCFGSLTDVPEEVDVAIIAVASHLVEAAIRDCVTKRVKFVVIFSSGFAEKGQEGLQKQNEILQLCKDNDIRVVGPNTLGAFNIKDQIFLSFTPATIDGISGEIGIVSQSGATGSIIMGMAMEEKLGVTYTLTTGNQMDLNTIDFIEFLISDEDTKIIGTYLEAVPDGDKLRDLADKALAEHKPIVMLKTGRSEAGQKAALSHTASLTGSSKVFEMVTNRHGITLVDGIDGMVDALKVFRSGKRPAGNRVATVVISGATGIMVADKLEDYGLKMANLSQETQKRLLEVVPSYCSVLNPVDIGQTLLDNPILYKHCIETLVQTDDVDIVILHLPVGIEKFAYDIIEVAKGTNKPIIVMHTCPEQVIGNVRKILNENYVPAYNSIESAVEAASHLVRYENVYNEYLINKLTDGSEVFKRTFDYDLKGLTVTEPQVKSILNQMNIPTPKGVVINDVTNIIAQTKHLKYPLVAKVVSPEISHKSDAGGVVLGIKDLDSLLNAYHTIIQNAKIYNQNAIIEGVLVEEMVKGPFLEAFIGVKKDPIFGPVILCGLGGIYVEILKDVSQDLAPVSRQDALRMIQQLKSYPLFSGVRNGLKYDVEGFADVLVNVSILAINLEGNWTELEINPLIVFEEGKGVMALDGLLTFASSEKTKDGVLQ